MELPENRKRGRPRKLPTNILDSTSNPGSSCAPQIELKTMDPEQCTAEAESRNRNRKRKMTAFPGISANDVAEVLVPSQNKSGQVKKIKKKSQKLWAEDVIKDLLGTSSGIFHRNNPNEKDAYGKKPQCGTAAYMHNFFSLPCLKGTDCIKEMDGKDITLAFFQATGFKEPIVVRRNMTATGLKVPDGKFGYADVMEQLGTIQIEKLKSDAMTERQNDDLQITLKELIANFELAAEDRKILNVLSLEISNTPLNAKVSPPSVINEMDWAKTCLPHGITTIPSKYCLLTCRDSYTDFHIDFGGTSVWYFIKNGRKIFYLIPPTEENLAKYEKWIMDNDRNEIQFRSNVTPYEVCLDEGELFFMPAGWIHAVFTPVDSLVFGGNILHPFAVAMQFRIADLEIRIQADERFKYPSFYRLNWCALKRMIISIESSTEQPSPDLLEAIQILYEEFGKLCAYNPALLTMKEDAFVGSVTEIKDDLRSIREKLQVRGWSNRRAIHPIFRGSLTLPVPVAVLSNSHSDGSNDPSLNQTSVHPCAPNRTDNSEDIPVYANEKIPLLHHHKNHQILLVSADNGSGLEKLIRGTPFYVVELKCFKLRMIGVEPSLKASTIEYIINWCITKGCVIKIDFHCQRTNKIAFIYLDSIRHCQLSAAYLYWHRQDIFIRRCQEKLPCELFEYAKER